MEGEGVTLADIMAALKAQSSDMAALRAQGSETTAALRAQSDDVQNSLASVKEEIADSVERVFKDVRAHVEEECKRVKEEVLEEVKEEVEKVSSDLKRYVDVAVASALPLPHSSARGSEAEDEGDGCDECGSRRGSRKSFVPLDLKLPTPPRTPVNILSPPPSPPGSVKSCGSVASSTTRRLRDGTRRRPQEFDGTVSWEAYKTQFELLASARQWSRSEMAMQLVWALKGAALEVLNQLPPAHRSSYSKVTAALERRYGYQHQTEVFRTRFRARVRGPGETLTRLAQDLEVLVRRAYPEASEEMITILLRDQFVDAIDNQQLRIYVQQAHPKDLQEALARGLELESFLRTTRERPTGKYGPHKVKAKKGKVVKSPSSPSPPPGEFHGNCFGCGQKGHSRKYCPQGKSGGKADTAEAGSTQYKPCCYNCGKGHRTAECTLVPATDSKEAAGNRKGLAEGVERQSEGKRPQSA